MNYNLLNYSKRSLAIGAFLVMTSASVFGQYVKDVKRSADQYYSKGDYYSAATYYEQFLAGGDKAKTGGGEPYTIQKKGAKPVDTDADSESNQEIIWRIAESYRLLNDYGNAEKWYAQAVKFDKTKYPAAAYYYAVSLRANAKYAEAQQQLESFLAASKQAALTELAKQELADVKFIQEQLKRGDAKLFTIEKTNTGRTGEGADYAAVKSGNTIYFTSTRADEAANDKKKNPYVNALFKVENGTAEKVNIPSAKNMEQGVAAVSPDGNRMYLTRWVSRQGKNAAAIYTSEKTATGWSEPVKLGDQINAEGYNAQQPFVTADGKYLLFASDKPGGSGKFDLYYAPLQANGEVGKATNLGRSINTKEDDQSPFYHQPSGTLVFASKGRVGMGGYDLYQSKGSIGSNWGEVENLGYPVNSNKDDMYFNTSSGGQLLRDAVISSDRGSACCLETFTVNKTYKKYIAGTVVDCKTNQPITNASVQLSVPSRLVASENGSYVFEVNDLSAAQLTASKTAYEEKRKAVNVINTEADTAYVTVCLAPVVVEVDPPVTPEKPPTPKVVRFDFAMYELRPETKVVLDTLAALLLREPMIGLELEGYTDQKGTDGFNKKLSELRALECKNYLLQKGVPEERIRTNALGECCPIEKETTPTGKDNPKAREVNRRVEFKIFLR